MDRALNLWQRLLNPSALVTDEYQRLQARLLAGVLIVMTALSLTGLVISSVTGPARSWTTNLIQVVITVFFGVSYVLSRTRFHRVGSAILVGSFTLMPLAVAIIDGPGTDALRWQIVPLLLSMVLLTMRATMWVALVNSTGLLLLPLFSDWTFGQAIVPLGVMAVATAMLMLYARHRTVVEIQSRQELLRRSEEAEAARADLDSANQSLEETVRRYVAFMAEVEVGDLSVALPLDDMGQSESQEALIRLGQQINRTIEGLRHMVKRYGETASKLNEAANEILASTTQQIAAASQQSAAISETFTTTDEVKVISSQAVERAEEVVEASQRTLTVSRRGQVAVEEAVTGMEQTKVHVGRIFEHIMALVGEMELIGEIAASVDDIAAQSSMLALNASVEAARAGEHGLGFAVVATEVRGLAEQSQRAVAQIRRILAQIVERVEAMAVDGEASARVVDVGQRLATRAGDTIELLASSIEDAGQVALQVKAGGQQQATGVEQIALAMQNINQGTVQSLDQARQLEEAARHLNELARELADLTQGYVV